MVMDGRGGQPVRGRSTAARIAVCFRVKPAEKPLGSWGAISTLSFHETKNFICGEGGALVLNDEALVERAEIARENIIKPGGCRPRVACCEIPSAASWPRTGPATACT